MANNPYAADVARIQAAIKQTQANIARDEAALAQNPGSTRLQQQVTSSQAYLANLQQELNIYLVEFNNFAAQPVASSGAVVGNANQARDENASATRPIQGSEVLDPDGRIGPAGQGSGTNAQPTPTTENNPTTGTNANVRPLTQTQAINNLSNRAGAGQSTADFAARDPRRTDLGGPGAGARGDDNTPSTPSVLINRLDALYAGNKNFIPSQANILDNFFSYTYSLSWYLVDPTLYNNGKFPFLSKDITGYYLLAQSGGAGTGAGAESSGPNVGVFATQYPGYQGLDPGSRRVLGAQRSPYFNLDFYIDNLELSTVYSCNVESGGPMTNSNISFTISEPNGITLPTNLFQAVQAVYGSLPSTQPKNSTTPASQINYAAALYCMVVRFYGYDEAGQLVVPIDNSPDSTDSSAAVEKFIFYQQNSLTYSMGSKLVEYKITGSVPSTQTGFSSNRGSIPFNMQFTGATVKDVLVGQIKQQTASQVAGDNTRNGVPIASAPPNPTNSQPSSIDVATAGGNF
jgi:hypothetical protein